MSEDPTDHLSRHAISDCCQAPVMSGGICSECKEHCEVEYENDEPNMDAITAKEVQRKNDQVYRELK